ncbi:hypothetical protein [Bradyrhizobium sp. JYMT SZCCT0428]|uniref:hypothetical protein n=1 Tax=Bradyrhizobium sp. JYMT SZCCT0428 TaxID=2807673 RepID=UPI0020121DAE|nr:hypothetical protein [Bradyrhizobium sp. JYMT SZCCT0428]
MHDAGKPMGTPMTTAELRAPAPAAGIAPATSAPRRIGLRIALSVIALLELYWGMSSAPTLLDDMSKVPGHGIGAAIVKLHLAVHPVLALSALLFAAIGYVRHAVMALGAVMLMTWLSYMPSVIRHGLAFNGPYAALETSVQIILFPLIAAFAIACAARDQRLGAATALVSTPTLLNLFTTTAFFIAMMMRGF